MEVLVGFFFVSYYLKTKTDLFVSIKLMVATTLFYLSHSLHLVVLVMDFVILTGYTVFFKFFSFCVFSYCIERKGDENGIWTCEECSSRKAKPSSNPSIKSARISQAVEIRLNRIKMRKQASFTAVKAEACADAERLINAKKPTSDSQNEKIERLPTSSHNVGNGKFKKLKRRLVLEDSSSEEESDSFERAEVDSCQLDPAINAHSSNISREIPHSEASIYVHAQPIIDPIWR